MALVIASLSQPLDFLVYNLGIIVVLSSNRLLLPLLQTTYLYRYTLKPIYLVFYILR